MIGGQVWWNTKEEACTCQCVECKVPKELLLHTDKLMPPLEI